MDFLDAVHKLATDNPDVSYSECRAAMQSETDSELLNLKGHNRYARAVSIAEARISSWLKETPNEDLYGARQIARFISSHRPACVWATLIAVAREQEAAPLADQDPAKDAPARLVWADTYGTECTVTFSYQVRRG